MKSVWALRFLLLCLTQSVVCGYITYVTKSSPSLNIRGENGVSFYSPNVWYRRYNGYPWWRVAFPSSWTLPNVYFTSGPHQLSDHFSSPLLTKLGYHYTGSEYNLPNLVVRPIVFKPILHDSSYLDDTDNLSSTENTVVPVSDDNSGNNYIYESNTDSESTEEFDKPDIINEQQYVPLKTSLNEYSSYNPGETNSSHFSPETTDLSSEFSVTSEKSKSQKSTSNNSPGNLHILLDSEMVNFNNSSVDNASNEDSNSEVQANESTMESSKPSTIFPFITSEYSSDTTATPHPTQIQLFLQVGLTENDGNVSHIESVLNSSISEDASISSEYSDQIFHLNGKTGKLNPKDLKGITNETSEISISATSAIDLPNETVGSNVVAAAAAAAVNAEANVNFTVLGENSISASPNPTEETNTLEGSKLMTQQMFNNNKIGKEPNDKGSSYENANLYSENLTTSFSPVESTTAENIVTKVYLNVVSTEPTIIATHASILPTELSTLIPLDGSEAGSNVFIEEGVVQLSTFDSTTNVNAQDQSGESPLPTLGSFSEASTTEIPNDLSTLAVGEMSLSEPNDILPMDITTASSESESLNASNYAEDATVSPNPELVLNLSLNVTSLSEESNTKETLILNTNTLNYLLMANESIEQSTEKLLMENSNLTTDVVEQSNKVHETENISSVLASEILVSSPSYSEDERISEQEAPTTQHSFTVSEAIESNDQLTESPFYSSITNFPLQILNSENWVNPTTEINSNFNPTQELSNEVNESGNLIVTSPSPITNSDNTNIHFPTNDADEIATASYVIKTKDSINNNHESENDSIIFPFNDFLPEKDSTNYHHNISFLDPNGNQEPLPYVDNFENISSINVHSFIEDPYNKDRSNIPEAYQNVMENGENINEGGVDSLVTQHLSVNDTGKGEENSRNEFAEISQDENPSESQDDYTISSKIDTIASTSEKTFPSTIDPEITRLPDDIIAISNQQDFSFNKNEDNPSDRSSLFTTPLYSDFENGNIHSPQFSENISNEDKRYNYTEVASISLSNDKVNEDTGSQLSVMKPENKYEFSQNDNQREVVNSHMESYTPAYSATGTENSLSLLHDDETHATENIIQEKSENNVYKGEESSSQNHNQGISEAKDDVDSAQIVDEDSLHRENTEVPSQETFASDVPTDYVYETEPSSYSFGGSLTEFEDDFSDSFYGLKFPEVTEPSHSLKKYLAQDNIEEFASTADDSVNHPPYVEESTENSNAQEKENSNPSDSQKPLTDIYYYEESPEILNEETYNASQEDYVYEDSSLPQENKMLQDNNFGSNSLPNSLKYIPQNTVGGFHRSDIPIEDEFSHDNPNSKGLLQRRKRRHATLSQAQTQKSETKSKLPSGDFSAIPHELAKGMNEKVTFSRDKRTFGKIPFLSIFHKRPELAGSLGFYKGKLIKNGILRPLLQKKLHFLHKKLFLTSLLAGLLDTRDSGHYKRSIQVKPSPAPHPCDPCDPHKKSIQSRESRESVEDDYSYSDDEYYYFDEKALEGADKSYEVKATPVYDDSDASITDFISMLPSFEGHDSD